jgi:hypothetical protein
MLLDVIASSRRRVRYLLDDMPTPVVAYSVRRLSASHTGACVRIRRSSDNTLTDIGFSGEQIDVGAITTFCGSGDGFIQTFYDQSGNSRNVTQATTTQQPIICQSGVVPTENGKPAVYSEGTRRMRRGLIELSGFTVYQIARIYNETETPSFAGAFGIYNGLIGSTFIRRASGGLQLQIDVSGEGGINVDNAIGQHFIATLTSGGNRAVRRYQRAQLASFTPATFTNTQNVGVCDYGQNAGGVTTLRGIFQEGIVWGSTLDDASIEKAENSGHNFFF